MTDGGHQPIRVVLTGDREWTDPFPVRVALEGLKARYGGARLHVCEGHARGLDRTVHDLCETLGINRECMPAYWAQLGKRAGPERNRRMLAWLMAPGADGRLVLAFHRDPGLGTGTADMCDIARRAGVPVYGTLVYPW